MRSRETLAQPEGLSTAFTPVTLRGRRLDVFTVVMAPKGKPNADLLFLHGMTDSPVNHLPLFRAWATQGIRVIGLDLPSHGQTRGEGNDLSTFTFEELFALVAAVEARTRDDASRPLILSGWSLGGLLAARLLQVGPSKFLGRPVAASVLFTPRVLARSLPSWDGRVAGPMLANTHDPNPPLLYRVHVNEEPWVTLRKKSQEAGKNMRAVSQGTIPADIPTLVFAGGDTDDQLAYSPAVRAWVAEQRESGARLTGVHCPSARHQVDNELPAYGGEEVRAAAAEFARAVSLGAQPGLNLHICRTF